MSYEDGFYFAKEKPYSPVVIAYVIVNPRYGPYVFLPFADLQIHVDRFRMEGGEIGAKIEIPEVLPPYKGALLDQEGG